MDDSKRMKKIKRVSALLKWIATVLIFLLPLVDAAWWIVGGFPSLYGLDIDMIPKFSPDIEIVSVEKLSAPLKLFGFLATLIPVGFASLVFYWLRALFRCFENLEIFTVDSVRFIRNMGWTLLIAQLVSPIYTALISLVLTFSNPPGHRHIVASLGTSELGFLAIALAILVISWVMEEGRRLKEESEGIV